MKLSGLIRIIVMLVAIFFGTVSQAREMRALVVGVSEYPNLSQDFQLEGPHNDAVRTRNVLMQRGFAPENIKVLADHVSDAALPTRANILAELDRLAKTATKDDFVFLYFAGHGSQQPADRSTAEGRAEADGLYEIFLPRDVGKWTGSVGGIENALVKTELRDAVDRILSTGAFVWGVFDSCHSATLVRGVEPGVHYRYVNPEALGVPRAALEAAAREAPKSRGVPAAAESPIIATTAHEGAGGSVFFYAAQTRETTPEMILPKGMENGQYYGLFGFTVMDALETGAPMTYRQMAQYVLTRYGAMNESRVTPLFSGTALDKPVLFQDSPLVQQWKIERGRELVVLAGALARLSEGAIVAVMADPLAKSDAAVGYLKLTKVSLASSTAVPVEFNGKPALKPEAIPDLSFARIVQTPPQYTLHVSVDAKDCDKHCATKVVVDGLRKAKTAKEGVAGTDIKWTDAPTTGDVMLKLLPDRILLLPPTLQGGDCIQLAGACEKSATLLLNARQTEGGEGGLHDKLTESLHDIARTTNLLRLAESLALTGSRNSGLEVTMKIVTKDGKEMPYSKEQVPALHAGDRISVSLLNNGSTSVDVTMLYVDSRYGINVLFPGGAGASNRLEPRANYDFDVDITDNTLGLERMLTIVVEAAKTQERADFSFLAQSPLVASRDIETRKGSDPDVMAFMDAGFSAYKTRGGATAPQAPSSRTSMQVFTLNITP
jgi:hypothetical protein